MALKPVAGRTSTEDLALPERRHFLETFATLIAIALEREKQEQAQQQAKVQVERERLRSALLSSISHDLRTPLAGISGSVETLLSFSDKGEDIAERELLSGIQTEAERLSLLLENILEMTRLESGQVNLRLELQPLEEVVGSTLNALEARLRNREVTVELPADLPLVRIDAVLIERVLVNLLDNALKYTPEGSPLLLEAKEMHGWVDVSLADKGPGLSGIDLEQLFTPFNQYGGAGSTSVQGSRGLGLGLSICKAIVEAHGGIIKAEERKDGGSIFSFTIPAGQAGTSPDESAAEIASDNEVAE
jgi:two-component system sensor histidine kinase KdpD